MMRTKLLAPFALLSLAACSSGGADDVRINVSEGTQPRIVGGTTSTSAQDSAIFLSNAEGYCSGTLIAPNLVLTAGHCVRNMNEDSDCGTFTTDMDPTTLSVAVGVDAMTATPVATGVKIFHPTETSGCSYDIGLLQLDKDIPNAKIANVRFTPVTAGETGMVAVGYGSVDDNNGDPPGRLQRGNLTITAAASTSFTYTEKNGKKIQVAVSPGEFATGESTCFGDSGGPLFDAMGNVVGATSRGVDQYCIDRPSIWSDTASHQKLITDAAVTAGHPLGVSGSSGGDPGTGGTSGTGSSTGSGTGSSTGSGSSGSGSHGTGSSDNSGSNSSSSGSSSASSPTEPSAPSTSSGGCSVSQTGSADSGGLGLMAIGLGLVLARRRRPARA